MFDEVCNEVIRSRDLFTENVKDSFGNSISEELFQAFLNNIQSAKLYSDESNFKEGSIRFKLAELRLML